MQTETRNVIGSESCRNEARAQHKLLLNRADIKDTFACEVMSYVQVRIEHLPSGTLISTDDVLYDGEFWSMTEHAYQPDIYEQHLSHLVALNVLLLKQVGTLAIGHLVYQVTRQIKEIG